MARGTDLVRRAVGAARAPLGSLRFIGEAQGCQHNCCEADAKAPQGLPARDRLGKALGHFIEFVVHNFLSSGSVVDFL